MCVLLVALGTRFDLLTVPGRVLGPTLGHLWAQSLKIYKKNIFSDLIFDTFLEIFFDFFSIILKAIYNTLFQTTFLHFCTKGAAMVRQRIMKLFIKHRK